MNLETMTIFKLLLKGLANLTAHRFEFALTLTAVILVSFLGFFLLLLAHNVQRVIDQDKGVLHCDVYWQQDAPREAVEKDWQTLRGMGALQDMRTYPPEKSLEVLAESLGGQIDLSWFARQNNPLPATAVLTFALEGPDPKATAAQLVKQLKSLALVDRVHYNPLELNTAGSWIQFSRTVLWPLMGLLALLVGLIVGNTIKLSQLHFQNEIDVLRLVGGSRWYIMLPLLAGGAFLAVFGGLFGLLLIKLAQLGLDAVLNVAPLWLEVHFLHWEHGLVTLGVLTSVAVLFSWVNIRQ